MKCNNSTLCKYSKQYEAFLFPTIYSLVFIIGLLGNLLAVGVIVQQLRRKNVLAVYLINLCISDLVYIFTLPVWAAYTANRENWTFGLGACTVVGFFFNTNIYTTIVFLSCMAVDRFLAIVFPLHAKGFRTMKAALIICIIVWLIVMGSHTVLLTHPEFINDTHNVQRCYEKYPMEQWVANLNYFRIFGVFLIPLLLLLMSYCFVIRAVHRSTGLEVREKRRIMGLLLSMVLIFVVAYLPYHIILFIRSYLSSSGLCSCEWEERLRPAYRIAFTFTSISSALDPIINIFASDSIKQDLIREVVSVRKWVSDIWSRERFKSARKPFLKSVGDTAPTEMTQRNSIPLVEEGSSPIS
ncbi:G-protein coupled receptor 4-like [Polypterus senegalus]